jgi:hypothetical protein
MPDQSQGEIMAVEIMLDDISKADESIRSAYTEKDGRYVLDPDAYHEIKSQGLKAKNRELLGKARQTRTTEEQLVEAQTKLRHYELTTPLREMALKAGIFPECIDLAMHELEKRFTLDENGDIVTLDQRGNPTDITPQRFLNEIYKSQRGHIYQASQVGGGGAQSGTRAGRSSNSISREAFARLSPQEKVDFSKQPGATIYD